MNGRVLPEVPVRQRVLSLRFALREALGLFIRALFASLRRRARVA